MSYLETSNQQEQKSTKEADGRPDLEEVVTRISEIVCKHGPELCTVGMTNLQANHAILLCLEQMLTAIQKAACVFGKLTSYSTGMAVLCEEDVKKAVTEFYDNALGVRDA